MRVNAVIQARTGSTRLPGKVLRDLGGRPVLDRVVDAARAADGVDRVVVATSVAPGDDAVAERAASLGVDVVRGSEDDVLARFVQAADEFPCDAVVRLTADCPLLDPALITLVAATWRSAPEHDYVATTLIRTLPRGLDVELATVAALRELATTAAGHDRIHVTSGLYGDPDRFHCLGLVVAPAANDLRVTLDTAEDLAALQDLVALLDGRTGWRAVVSTLREHPEVVARNAHVRQKSLSEG
ncbi:cytidylyltransferase domain-containing protein [Pseudonocardia phyllosphaerae]|uniref:cytidylyltransferase domain-containing protein n=1 Tax=Pseudonocardia phyllosphaerae TaxID=3390502 RepID=UPI00397D8F81